jgi:integrase
MENTPNFQTQAEAFLAEIGTRKRRPVRGTTLVAYRSLLNSHVLPILGQKPLSEIENGALKALVTRLSAEGLAAATITVAVGLAKAIVKSAVDANGNQLFPRTWNNDFMDLPVVSTADQAAPVITPKTVWQAISRASGAFKPLYALLAGTGLRAGEALALMVGLDDGKNSFWDPETATVTIRTTVSRGQIRPAPKTEAGVRQVDLAPELNTYLAQLLLDGKLPSHGLLFPNEHGGVIPDSTRYDHTAKDDVPGFHSFRRFRITHLRKQGVPEGLIQFWAGHQGKSITDRYDKIGQDVEARKQFAARAGLGFRLETT